MEQTNREENTTIWYIETSFHCKWYQFQEIYTISKWFENLHGLLYSIIQRKNKTYVVTTDTKQFVSDGGYFERRKWFFSGNKKIHSF